MCLAGITFALYDVRVCVCVSAHARGRVKVTQASYCVCVCVCVWRGGGCFFNNILLYIIQILLIVFLR
jgi:hypothetical protein